MAEIKKKSEVFNTRKLPSKGLALQGALTMAGVSDTYLSSLKFLVIFCHSAKYKDAS